VRQKREKDNPVTPEMLSGREFFDLKKVALLRKQFL
jgi:hypothetical protein